MTLPELHDLCAAADVPDGAARGFVINTGGVTLDIFIVRRGKNLYAYLNRCPHTGVTLNWQPDQFMDLTGTVIQCSTHGARFRTHDGYCTYGPCAGKFLTALTLTLELDRIKIKTRPCGQI